MKLCMTVWSSANVRDSDAPNRRGAAGGATEKLSTSMRSVGVARPDRRFGNDMVERRSFKMIEDTF